MIKKYMILEIEQYCRDNNISKYDMSINPWKGNIDSHEKWVLQNILEKIKLREKEKRRNKK